MPRIGERVEADSPGRTEDPADEVLMGAASRGDAGAFRELADRHGRRLFGFFLHMTGDREASLDLVQDTFARAWSARRRDDPARPFRPWLYAIAANLRTDLARSWLWRLSRRARSAFERSASEEALLLEALPGPDRDRPDLTAQQRVAADRLRAEIARLPWGQRRAIVLHDLEGLTCREVAEVTGHPVGTVMSWLKRARGALRERLQAAGGREAWL